MLDLLCRQRGFIGGVASVVAVLGVGVAQADLTHAHLEIRAETTIGGETFVDTKTFETVWNPDQRSWSYSTSAWDVFADRGIEIGYLNPDMSGLSPEDQALHQTSTGIFLQQDPIVNLNFAVQANGTDTTFTITSALLSFPTINSAIGQSSASFAVSDTNGLGGGATLTGAVPGTGGHAYRAAYNGFAGMDLGTTFSTHVLGLSAPVFGTDAVTEDQLPIGIGSVSDMSSKIRFTLTAGDLASGSTVYEIVPEPASLALLVFGAAMLVRRR